MELEIACKLLKLGAKIPIHKDFELYTQTQINLHWLIVNFPVIANEYNEWVTKGNRG